MSRLVREDIYYIEENIQAYDRILQAQTGHTLAELGQQAAGYAGEAAQVPVAVITVTAGLGALEGFAASVAAILAYCGATTQVMERQDVAGIQEAFQKGKQLIFMADEDVFSAFGAGSRAQADNGEATGRAFAAALLGAMGVRGSSAVGAPILILGAGPVGRAAAAYLAKAGAAPCAYDVDPGKSRKLCEACPGVRQLAQPPQYREYRYILDATTAGGIIGEGEVGEDTIIAAPGMPCGVTKEAARKATVIHNPLELGVAAMYYQCLKQMEEEVAWIQRKR